MVRDSSKEEDNSCVPLLYAYLRSFSEIVCLPHKQEFANIYSYALQYYTWRWSFVLPNIIFHQENPRVAVPEARTSEVSWPVPIAGVVQLQPTGPALFIPPAGSQLFPSSFRLENLLFRFFLAVLLSFLLALSPPSHGTGLFSNSIKPRTWTQVRAKGKNLRPPSNPLRSLPHQYNPRGSSSSHTTPATSRPLPARAQVKNTFSACFLARVPGRLDAPVSRNLSR
jgi:hypothetical protein